MRKNKNLLIRNLQNIIKKNMVDENLEYSDTYTPPVFIQSSECSKKLSQKYGYKEWMISRFLDFIPDPENLLEFIETRAKSDETVEYIRVNTLKIDPEKLKRKLTEKGYLLSDTVLKEVFEVRRKKRDNDGKKDVKLSTIGSTTEYLKGYYYIQDLSSCIAVEELDIDGNDIEPFIDFTVLDMAASPGGKTTFIAQKMRNKGIVIACEPNLKRLTSLFFNLSRCSIKNTLVFNLHGEDVGKLKMMYDRILLDAPCTCEGIILKDESRKKSRNLIDIGKCSNRQKKLIQTAFQTLKPNGVMIYSTCSFAPEENEMIIEYLINQNKNARIEPLRFGLPGLTNFDKYQFTSDMVNTGRFYPHIHDTSGFFIAKIRKDVVN